MSSVSKREPGRSSVTSEGPSDASDGRASQTFPISTPSPQTPSPTENYRRQHAELLELALQIGKRLTPEDLKRSAPEVRRLLAQFAGKLNMHARMENDAFYPRLFAHRDEAARARAHELFSEVGGIYDAFHEFLKAWPSAASIEENPAEFIRQTGKVLRILGKRMMREEAELYPLVDALEGR
jgi:hypothetical protein